MTGPIRKPPVDSPEEDLVQASISIANARDPKLTSSVPDRQSGNTERLSDRNASYQAASSATTLSSPSKAGSTTDGKPKALRKDVEVALAYELSGRRAKSDDLVSSIFHSYAIEECQQILQTFVKTGIVSVEDVSVDSKSLTPLSGNELDDAVKFAATQAQNCTTQNDRRYTWKWSEAIDSGDSGKEDNTAFLFNVISIAAYTVAVNLQSSFTSDEHESPRRPVVRFITLPYPDAALPLSKDEEQDCRPDVIALRSDAFFPVDDKGASTPWRYTRSKNEFTILRETFPLLFDFCSRQFLTGSEDAEEAYGSGSNLAFEEWYRKQESCTMVDLSRVCWPEVEHAIESKLSNNSEALMQALLYMRVQRRSQPWLRSVVGLFMTNSLLGILRSDAVGVEQCIVNKSTSRGVLDTIRICLGLALASEAERGYHPFFKLAQTRSLNPLHPDNSRQLPPPSVPSMSILPIPAPQFPLSHDLVRKRKRSDGSQDEPVSVHEVEDELKDNLSVFAPDFRYIASDAKTSKQGGSRSQGSGSGTRSKKARLEAGSTSAATESLLPQDLKFYTVPFFTHRLVQFICIPNSAYHYPKPGNFSQSHSTYTRYYVHHLVDDRGSLVGRSARIFCVSREVTSEDPDWPKDIPTDSHMINFVGVYALKMYYASSGSECHEDDLIDKARRAKIAGILLPTREWRVGSALVLIRGYSAGQVEEAKDNKDSDTGLVWPGVECDRHEVFAQTDLKRTLAEFTDLPELVSALSDVVRAVVDLEGAGILHRDISMGNILLKREVQNVQFFEAASRDLRRSGGPNAHSALFVQRAFDPEETGGVLHDFDMAGSVTFSDAHEAPPEDEQPKTRVMKLFKEPSPSMNYLKARRTGTPPYMAANLLKHKHKPHCLEYDLCSIFYVLYLFAMSTEGCLEEQVYPARFDLREKPWLPAVLKWAHISREGLSMDSLGAHKANFFEEQRKVIEHYRRAASPYWMDESAAMLCIGIFYIRTWPALTKDEEPERRELSKAGKEYASSLLEELNAFLVGVTKSDAHAAVVPVT